MKKNDQTSRLFTAYHLLTFMFAIVVVSGFSTNVSALSLDIRSEYERWQSGLAGTSTGVMLGIGMSHNISPALSIGGSVTSGKFSTDARATSSTKRTDFDVVLNYRLYPTIPVFIGYQQRNLSVDNKDDQSRSFDDMQYGLGLGIRKYVPIKRRLLLFSGITVNAILAVSDVKNSSKVKGKGFSSSVQFGTLYAISKVLSVGMTARFRSTNVKYRGDAGKWSHNSLTVGMSLSRAW